MFRKFTVCMAVVMSFCLFNNVSAQQFGPPIPLFLNYQGKLEFQGIPTSDTKDITFSIYDVPEGGVALWDETQRVETRVGIFNVILGEVNSIPLIFDQDLWLGVQVEGENEMSPRQMIASSGYSFMAQDSYNSDKVDGIDATATPVENTLLALDGNIKFPNSVLYMGPGNKINADLLDDKHYSDIADEIDDDIEDHKQAYGHLSNANAIDLTDGGATTLHYHAINSCPQGSSIRGINPNGSVVCEPDTDTQLSKSTVQQWANEVDDVNDAVSNPSGSYPSMSVGYASNADAINGQSLSQTWDCSIVWKPHGYTCNDICSHIRGGNLDGQWRCVDWGGWIGPAGWQCHVGESYDGYCTCCRPITVTPSF